MGILLTILKIIGITILIILALIIVILLCILFVPIRYKVQGAYKESFHLHGKITWAFPILYIKAIYEEELALTIRVLGIKLPLLKDKASKKDSAKGKNEKEATDNSISENSNESVEIEAVEKINESTNSREPVKAQRFDKPDKSLKKTDDTEDEAYEESNVDLEKKSFFKKIKDFIKAIFELPGKIKAFLQNIATKIKSIKEKINYYIRVLKSDTAKAAFSVCKERIIKLFKCILPRKGRVNVTFGMEDPATTGQIMGIHGMLYPIIGNIVFLNPNFEEPCMECDFYVKGKIRPGCVLYQVVRVLFDKNCRKLIRLLKGR